MKRRTFLVNGALVGLGLFFLPGKLFSRSRAIIVQLPKAKKQVRHGYFNLHEESPIRMPNGVSNIHFQRFFKNGYAESINDLCVASFEYENEKIVVPFTFSEIKERGHIQHEQTGKLGRKIFQLVPSKTPS